LKLKQCMKKHLFLSGIVMASYFVSFGQNAERIQRAYAFFTSSTPGMIRVDENGNPVKPDPIIERFIYIECPGTKTPVITTVLYNKTAYTPGIARVDEMNVHVGKKNENGQEIVLTPKKGDRFWKLTLEDPNGRVPADAGNIIIQGKTGGKTYKFYVYKEIQLLAPQRY
jgi:hypothetical protein